MLLRAAVTGLLLTVLALAACGDEEIPSCTPESGSSVDPC